MADRQQVIAALATIRQRGAIGERSLERAVDHAERFVRLIPADCRELVDLGSGGGLPGLVIAAERPDVNVVLVERRATRADMLRRAVRALGLTAEVVGGDVRKVAVARARTFDVVTARSFAVPAETAKWVAALLRRGGVGLVSEPPPGAAGRWSATLLAVNGLTDHGVDQGIRILERL